MKILVLGSGGREHALVWRLAGEHGRDNVIGAPGNAGIARTASVNAGLNLSDSAGVAALAKELRADLVVIGPEQPLVDGLADLLEDKGIKVFGPGKSGARLEGSKIFAKEFMVRNNIPTAGFEIFEDEDEAIGHLEKIDFPAVIKADGLAAGKGVTVAASRAQAEAAIRACFSGRAFGAAGDRILIEECLDGFEVSILALTDGKTIAPLAPAQDYKRAFDGDFGPNTGGMGCYSPVPHMTPDLLSLAYDTVLKPAVNGLAGEGIDYRGVLYAGLMIGDGGPKVLEFNSRFGDPETQAVVPRLASNLTEALLATSEGRLDEVDIRWSDERCVSVVLASGGYPGQYHVDYSISGLDDAGAAEGAVVFHAGTALAGDSVVTRGGRVLNVTALGPSFEQARSRTYQAIRKIHFENMHFRTDICAEISD